jgi:hypothetical protein
MYNQSIALSIDYVKFTNHTLFTMYTYHAINLLRDELLFRN